MRMTRIVFFLMIIVSLSAPATHAQPVPCGLLTSEFPQPGANMYSKEEEREFGKQRIKELGMSLSRASDRRIQVFKDQRISEYVEPLLEKILVQFPSFAHEFTYEIYLYDDVAPNVLAVTGGHIAISLGEIIEAPSDDFLAFVLAHEIAHIALRHETRIETIKKLYYLEDRLLYGAINPSSSPQPPEDEVRVLTLLKQDTQSRLQLLNQQSAAQELEADYLSVQVSVRAGFNPKSVIEKHAKDAEEQGRGSADGKTHPHSFLRSLMYRCGAPENAHPEAISPELRRAKEVARMLLPKPDLVSKLEPEE